MIYKFFGEMNQLIHIKGNCRKYSATKRAKKATLLLYPAFSLRWRINYISEHLQSNYFSQYDLNKKQTSVEIVLKTLILF